MQSSRLHKNDYPSVPSRDGGCAFTLALARTLRCGRRVSSIHGSGSTCGRSHLRELRERAAAAAAAMLSLNLARVPCEGCHSRLGFFFH